MYKNILAFRMSCRAYARTVMPAVSAASQSKVTVFMRQHTLDKGEPSMAALIKRFVAWVRVVQRHFRRVQMMRRARVEALLQRFVAAELIDPSFAAAARLPAIQPHPQIASSAASPTKQQLRRSVAHAPVGTAAALGRVERPRSSGPQSARGTGRVGGAASMLPPRQPGNVGPLKNTRPARRTQSASPATRPRRTAILESGPLAFEKDFVNQELLPDVVRIHVLHEHVKEMQRSLPDRMKAWLKRKEATCLDEEVQRFVLGPSAGAASLAGPRPRSVEPGRLRCLYASAYDAYLRGSFKHLVFDRMRLLKRAWHVWRRRTAFGTLEEAMPPHSAVERATDVVGTSRRAHRPDSASLIRRCATALVVQPPGGSLCGSRRPSISSRNSSRRPSQERHAAMEFRG